ncbi:MAG: hypothetical protein ACR2G5_15615 [Pyrinomonadaceae bacterium]
MRFKGAGRSLMAAGVVCIIIYVLAGLYGDSATALRVGNLLFYIGIIAIILGVALRLSRSTSRS